MEAAAAAASGNATSHYARTVIRIAETLQYMRRQGSQNKCHINTPAATAARCAACEGAIVLSEDNDSYRCAKVKTITHYRSLLPLCGKLSHSAAGSRALNEKGIAGTTWPATRNPPAVTHCQRSPIELTKSTTGYDNVKMF